MQTLTITSCMAPLADAFCATLAHYIGEQLALPTAFIGDIPWQERERRFDAGAIPICWICGLPYVWKADRGHPRIDLLAAPVMQGDRYQDRPVYFSDVVVRRRSRFRTFADLRGATWAYNERTHHRVRCARDVIAAAARGRDRRHCYRHYCARSRASAPSGAAGRPSGGDDAGTKPDTAVGCVATCAAAGALRSSRAALAHAPRPTRSHALDGGTGRPLRSRR